MRAGSAAACARAQHADVIGMSAVGRSQR